MVVERGIAVSYKYNPLASVPVPEICVPVLCSRAQKVAVIVIKRKCRLIPDLPAPVAQLFVRGGSVDFMTNFELSQPRLAAAGRLARHPASNSPRAPPAQVDVNLTPSLLGVW